MSDVCLITPTRDRPEAMALCARWMRRQTFLGTVQWLIIDDGNSPIQTTLPFPAGWAVEHVQREPSTAQFTLTENLLEAITRVDARNILIIEDDEHYSPLYVEEMVWRLRDHDMAGECRARYYNVAERRWSVMDDNSEHASLCRTGFRSSLLPAFRDIVAFCKQRGDPFVDILLWNCAVPPKQRTVQVSLSAPVMQDQARPWAAAANWRPTGKQAPQTSPQAPPPPYPRSKIVTPPPPDHTPSARRVLPNVQFLPAGTRVSLFEGRGISVGIKGMPGRGGIGRAHNTRAFPNVDPHWRKLIEWIGPDVEPYIELAKRLEWRPLA
jgi:hypothetical protein